MNCLSVKMFAVGFFVLTVGSNVFGDSLDYGFTDVDYYEWRCDDLARCKGIARVEAEKKAKKTQDKKNADAERLIGNAQKAQEAREAMANRALQQRKEDIARCAAEKAQQEAIRFAAKETAERERTQLELPTQSAQLNSPVQLAVQPEPGLIVRGWNTCKEHYMVCGCVLALGIGGIAYKLKP